MILADCRYNRHDKRSKLPKWILQFLGAHCLNLSTNQGIQQVQQFLRLMGQPIDQKGNSWTALIVHLRNPLLQVYLTHYSVFRSLNSLAKRLVDC
jgi:hypothetical protein